MYLDDIGSFSILCPPSVETKVSKLNSENPLVVRDRRKISQPRLFYPSSCPTTYDCRANPRRVANFLVSMCKNNCEDVTEKKTVSSVAAVLLTVVAT